MFTTIWHTISELSGEDSGIIIQASTVSRKLPKPCLEGHGDLISRVNHGNKPGCYTGYRLIDLLAKSP